MHLYPTTCVDNPAVVLVSRSWETPGELDIPDLAAPRRWLCAEWSSTAGVAAGVPDALAGAGAGALHNYVGVNCSGLEIHIAKYFCP
jgi:hypothetical protein